MPPRQHLQPQTAPGMLRVLDPDAKASGRCGRSSPPEPRAGCWCAEAASVGMGTMPQATCPPCCWIGLVKSLKIYICVVSLDEGLNLYLFSTPSTP